MTFDFSSRTDLYMDMRQDCDVAFDPKCRRDASSFKSGGEVLLSHMTPQPDDGITPTMAASCTGAGRPGCCVPTDARCTESPSQGDSRRKPKRTRRGAAGADKEGKRKGSAGCRGEHHREERPGTAAPGRRAARGGGRQRAPRQNSFKRLLGNCTAAAYAGFVSPVVGWVTERWSTVVRPVVTRAMTRAAHLVKGFLLLALNLLLLVTLLVAHCALLAWGYVTATVKRYVYGQTADSQRWSNVAAGNLSTGDDLEANISLPTSGEEAMQRLLSCQQKNPYSILGVTPAASDEDIKRYYRRQAVLVHPDKNKQAGAEEAFKILAHAFDLIGEPDNKRKYDLARESQASQACMEEFQDLLRRLNEKMQEEANVMRCDTCGDKHSRIPTTRPIYAARFCRTCDIYHSAKEGDLWAECEWLGFLWHYYACMDGGVFDVTAWASCQGDRLGKMKPNSHRVQIHLLTGQNRGRQHNSASNEANVEEFLNHLFHQSTASHLASQPASHPASHPASANGGDAHEAGQDGPTGGTKKGSGQRKKGKGARR